MFSECKIIYKSNKLYIIFDKSPKFFRRISTPFDKLLISFDKFLLYSLDYLEVWERLGIFANKKYNMKTSTLNTAAQMIIDIQDYSVVKDLKRLLSRVEGIGKISVKKNYYESAEFYKDLDSAEQDIAQGKGIVIDGKDALDAL